MQKTIKPNQMNFLIVDDMDNMRRSIRAMLKLLQFGKEFYEAPNGKEAWEILNDEYIDINFIISDWRMPKMTGVELLTRVRASKQHRDLPFLMITAESNQSIIAEAAECDVDAYLTKPFVTVTLEQKINELLQSIKEPPLFKSLLLQARTLKENGDIEGAINCATKAAGLNKRSSRPLRELGQLFLQKNDLTRSIACFEKATKLNRLDVPAYQHLGQIYFKQGNIDKALANYSVAVELSPRLSDRAFKFADLLIQKNKLAEAEQILKILIKNNSENYDIIEEVANMCLDKGIHDLAIKCLKIIMRENPERHELNKRLAKALKDSGQTQEAIQIYEKTVDRFPQDVEILLALAQLYMDVRMRMRADKWATKVIRIDPTNKEARDILDKCL